MLYRALYWVAAVGALDAPGRIPRMLRPRHGVSSSSVQILVATAVDDGGEAERRQRMMDVLFQPERESFLDKRDDILGVVDSHELLERDALAGVGSELLSSDPDEPQMVFVDEFACIGCKNCAEVSRSTFTMTDKGTARAYQQGADERSVMEEAIDCCPVDCIHFCSQRELSILERHRADTFDARWATWQTRRLVARGEGRDGVPSWREPLVRPTG